jgi:hypothetical protein
MDLRSVPCGRVHAIHARRISDAINAFASPPAPERAPPAAPLERRSSLIN